VPLEPVVRYRALFLAPTGDRLHVFGNRAGRVVDTVNQLREEAAVVTSVDLTSHARSAVTVREADGRSWFVYWAAFSVDGTRLVATYHGGCNGEYLRRCTGGARTRLRERLAASRTNRSSTSRGPPWRASP
jgi:hypothetical protein